MIYWCVPREHIAGQNHDMEINNKPTERVEQFKYLGTALTYLNDIHKEIKTRLKSGNACYHSVMDLLSSGLLSKNLKIKIYRTIILPFFFVWVWNLVSHTRGANKLRVFVYRVLKRIYWLQYSLQNPILKHLQPTFISQCETTKFHTHTKQKAKL